MSISIDDVSGYRVLVLKGEIDLACSPELRAALLAELREGRHTLIDLGAVSYIDSSGIASLVEGYQLARKAGVKFGLVGVNPSVLAIFKLARLDLIFPIHERVPDDLDA